MSMEAYLLYQNSIDTLMESNCSDFMVYKLFEGNRNYHLDIDNWDVELEISEGFYSKLHINLCQKLRPSARVQ
jgi:hypothetical protein